MNFAPARWWCLALALALSACETTNSFPYKASTGNVIAIQEALRVGGGKVQVGAVRMATGIDESPLCRLLGAVRISPGKSISTYVREALQEEIFASGHYDAGAPVIIEGTITELSFSSVAPASWTLAMTVKTRRTEGYSVRTHFPFDTSWTATSACKNVADAFGPAVQSLLRAVVTDPRFAELVRQ